MSINNEELKEIDKMFERLWLEVDKINYQLWVMKARMDRERLNMIFFISISFMTAFFSAIIMIALL